MRDDARGDARFPDTSWGLVLAAADDAVARRAAFDALCRRYWAPIYASLRRQGFVAADAEDLTQGFFQHLIEHATVTRADRGRGRFRSFLLGALRRFLADEREREISHKRGGGQQFVVFDAAAFEAKLPAHDADLSLDLQFDRQWARTLLDNALAALRNEYARSGQENVYEQLRLCLDPAVVTPDYAELARRLERNEGALKVAVHRLRGRFRAVLRREVACTLANPGDVEEELAYLRDVLSAEAAA